MVGAQALKIHLGEYGVTICKELVAMEQVIVNHVKIRELRLEGVATHPFPDGLGSLGSDPRRLMIDYLT